MPHVEQASTNGQSLTPRQRRARQRAAGRRRIERDVSRQESVDRTPIPAVKLIDTDLAGDVTAVRPTRAAPVIDFSASERLGVSRPAPPDFPGAAERAEEARIEAETPRPQVQPASSVAVASAEPPRPARAESRPSLVAPGDRIGAAIGRRLAEQDIEATERFQAKSPISQDLSRLLAGVGEAPFVGAVPRAFGVDPEEQARIDPGGRGTAFRTAGMFAGVGTEIAITKSLAGQFARGARAGTIPQRMASLIAETEGGTVGRRALRGALEGVPTDVGFAMREDDLGLSASLALGSGVGAAVEVALPVFRRAVAPVRRNALQDAIEAGADVTTPAVERRATPRGPVTPQGESPTLRRRLFESLDPSIRRDLREAFIDTETQTLNQKAWQNAKPRVEADPDIEITVIDLTNFKGLNDLVSRTAGDARLREVGRIIREVAGVSERDIFRAGGDEFAIVSRVGEGDAIGQRIVDAVPDIPVGNSGIVSRSRFGVGQTFDQADAAAQIVKKAERGPRFRGPEGEAPPRTVNTEAPLPEAASKPPPSDARAARRQSASRRATARRSTSQRAPESPGSVPLDPPVGLAPKPPVGVDTKLQSGFFDMRTVTQATKGFLRRAFTSAGDLPKGVFDAKVRRDALISTRMSEIKFAMRDFDDGVREAFGTSRLTEEQKLLVDDALKGQVALESLPDPLRGPVRRMREHIDAQSRAMVDSGLVEGELAAKIADNMGVYAARSYRVFDDPNWAGAVPRDVRNKAKAFLRAERPELSEEQIEGLIGKILFRGDDGPMALLASGSRLGSKDLSMLIKRKDIAPEIRALMGEFRDPKVNYARSVTKMANTLANHEFLTTARRDGMGTFFFEKPVVTDAGEFVARISADGSQVMAPLNGLYTTPDILRAFEEQYIPRDKGGAWDTFFRSYMKINSAVKFSKTVLSLMTHVRNVIGNVGFATANGHVGVQHFGRAIEAVNASIGATRLGRRAVGLPAKDETVWRDYYLRIQKLGVVDQSAHAGELRDAIRDATKTGIDNLEPDVGLLRKTLSGVTDVYRAEDDVWKVFAFENEYARYRKAKPQLTEGEVEEIAARNVRNTYPTYSLVPSGIKALRRVPLIGTFTSFPAEVFRTLYNTLELTSRELRDPDLRSVGAQRVVGMGIAATAVSGAAMASRFLTGITETEDEDVRKFVAPWTENSDIVYLGKDEDTKYKFVDLSYVDPYSYLRTPLRALMRGEDWRGALFDAVSEITEPFVGEEILAGKLLDISRNQKRDGGRVFNPEDHFISQTQDRLAHIYDAIEPGTITSARRIAKGLSGTTTVFGRAYDPKLEALAVFTGQRIQELDVSQSMSFRASEINGRLNDANRILNSVGRRRGTVSEEELTQAFVESEQSRQRVFAEAHQISEAAVRLGMGRTQVEKILRDSGMSRANANAVMQGNPPPPRLLNSDDQARNALVRQLTIQSMEPN